MTHYLKTSTAVAALALGISACASAPEPNPRLISAEAALAAAKANPETLEMGRMSLEQAEIALNTAQIEYRKRDQEDYEHAIRMTEGYIELAETRGDKKRTELAIADIKAASDEARIQSRDRTARQQDARATAAENEAARANRMAANANAARAAAEARNQQLRTQLADYKMQQTQTGMTLVLQDMQFATASAVLRDGAKGRLTPLLAYLNQNPEARIRIEGHTDAEGEDAANMALSERRASAVGAYLTEQGVAANRITAVGMGETRPVGSNDTVSGREQNRRVEITILNSNT